MFLALDLNRGKKRKKKWITGDGQLEEDIWNFFESRCKMSQEEKKGIKPRWRFGHKLWMSVVVQIRLTYLSSVLENWLDTVVIIHIFRSMHSLSIWLLGMITGMMQHLGLGKKTLKRMSKIFWSRNTCTGMLSGKTKQTTWGK